MRFVQLTVLFADTRTFFLFVYYFCFIKFDFFIILVVIVVNTVLVSSSWFELYSVSLGVAFLLKWLIVICCFIVFGIGISIV